MVSSSQSSLVQFCFKSRDPLQRIHFSEKWNLRALFQGVSQLTASAAVLCSGVLHLHNALQWTIFLNEAIKPLQRLSLDCYWFHLHRWEFQGEETQWQWLKLALSITLESWSTKNFELAASGSALLPLLAVSFSKPDVWNPASIHTKG